MREKQKSFLSVVVYVHNNEKTIGSFLKMLYHVFSANFEHYEIICVDDASADGSAERIREAAGVMKDMTLSILHMSYFQGIEPAMAAGVDLAIGDYVYEFDGPEQDYPEEFIMEVYEKALSGYDAVSAVPKRRQRFSSALFYRLYRCGTAGRYEMRTERFRVLSRRLLNRVGGMHRRVPYRKAVYAASGLPMERMEYACAGEESRNRDHQEKEYRQELAVTSLILFTDLGYKFSIRMTFLMMGIAMLMGIYAAMVYLYGSPIEGWTTTVLFMAFAFFGLFGILTIIVKYLSVLVELIFKRQPYVTEGVEKITK